MRDEDPGEYAVSTAPLCNTQVDLRRTLVDGFDLGYGRRATLRAGTDAFALQHGMNTETSQMTKRAIEATALTIRSLTMDAVEEAGSGHPGLPMGLAELGAVLYGEVISHCVEHPDWPDRDRFVLSAGHGCLLQYCLLHLSGYPITLGDLRAYRKMGSKCPAHPEYGLVPGIEATTGPLGQGVGMAVGMAIAEQMLAARFNTPEHAVVHHYTYAIASDGDMMEGVCSEACSLAGHLGLSRLIVFYDMNGTTIEGPTSLSFTEDVGKRFEAYGWQVLEQDAYDVDGVLRQIDAAKRETNKPTLIRVRSLIGKGAPNKQGSSSAHGSPLGKEEVEAARANLGLNPDQQYYVDPQAVSYFAARREKNLARHEQWRALFEAWSGSNPGLRRQWDCFWGRQLPASVDELIFEWPAEKAVAPRAASGKTLAALMTAMPNLVGGSADLASSNGVDVPEHRPFARDNGSGRLIHFGVREHAMAAISNGITLHGGLRAFCATYLVFSDYMRASIRLAALMELPTVFVLTHDSVYVGEDGPTHQPVEHLAALRAIPNVWVLRPGDAEETVEAWKMALNRTGGPTVLALARQASPVYEKPDRYWRQTIQRGAHVVRGSDQAPDITLVATGSEVSLALEAAQGSKRRVRVVSMVSREIFAAQDQSFRDSVIPPGAPVIVVEAGVGQGWESYVRKAEDLISISRFGLSGPGREVASRLGLSKQQLLRRIEATD